MNFDPTVSVKIQADTSGFEKTLEELTQSTQSFGQVLTSTLKQAAISGKSFDDTLKNLGSRLASLALTQALRPLENLFSGLVGGLFGGNAGGGLQTPIVPFAKGGVVANPTFFQHGGGLGILGEKGSEAILPLQRGADGKLGVSAGASGNPINVVFNVTANDAASFRKSESQMTTMLARAVARGKRGL